MALCYLDKTFCKSDCINNECYRFFGAEEKEGAEIWWAGCSGEPPIAFSDFSDGCEGYISPEEIILLTDQ